ncbi:MAG: hypothetical protein U5J98_09145 [Halobacteriales archaeon]|nr:hypothetical protein [Halobacteriales archaeon]
MNRQIDQAQGFGIGRFVVRMQRGDDLRPIGEIAGAALLAQQPVEVSITRSIVWTTPRRSRPTWRASGS